MPTPTFTSLGPDGVEAVGGELWFWRAVYSDGTTLVQFDAEDKTFHRFAEIDLGRLDVFEVRRALVDGQVFAVRIRPGMRPIFFRRHQRLNVGTPAEKRLKFYCFGYQETVGGRNVKTLLTIYPDGSVAVENTDGRD